MSRYIDADKIDYSVRPVYSGISLATGEAIYLNCAVTYERDIDEMPTADVVEVVRCKECKHLTVIDDVVMCSRLEYHSEDADLCHFCSYGERRE